DRLARDLRHPPLAHGRLAIVGLARVTETERAVGQPARRLEIGVVLGERKRHALELRDRPPERFAALHPIDGHVDRTPRGAEAHEAEQRPAELELAHDLLETLADLAELAGTRHVGAVEGDRRAPLRPEPGITEALKRDARVV